MRQDYVAPVVDISSSINTVLIAFDDEFMDIFFFDVYIFNISGEIIRVGSCVNTDDVDYIIIIIVVTKARYICV